VLSYQVSTFRPRQLTQKDRQVFNIEINDLNNMTKEASEIELERSSQELITSPWRGNCTPLRARLFYLRDKKTELQLAIPHILADEISLEILFTELSQHYLGYAIELTEKDNFYRDYLFAEQAHSKAQIDSGLLFWEKYLQDARLFTFPESVVVPDMEKSKLPYSRYTEIQPKLLSKIQDYCLSNQIAVDQALTSVLLLALVRCTGDLNLKKTICVNKVKSTRHDPKYDKTIGCFLRIEPIKVQFENKQSLRPLCQQIQDSLITTNPYQDCSSLIKLASISNFPPLGKMKTLSLNLLIHLHNLVFPTTPLNNNILKSAVRLNTDKANHFLINVNVQSSFLRADNEKSTYFGFNSELISSNKNDLLTINNLLDVCFLRMVDQKSYLIISANLNADFQNSLSNEVLTIFQDIF
jgi:hypothetical protein